MDVESSPSKEEDIDQSHAHLVATTTAKQQKNVQVLPHSPPDFCTCCDPICIDVEKLAYISTFCCWMLLGIFPIIVGFFAIYCAKREKNIEPAIIVTVNPDQPARPSYMSKESQFYYLSRLY